MRPSERRITRPVIPAQSYLAFAAGVPWNSDGFAAHFPRMSDTRLPATRLAGEVCHAPGELHRA
jgi:hypothetical protein